MFIIPIQPMKLMELTESAPAAIQSSVNRPFQDMLNQAMQTVEETKIQAVEDGQKLAFGDIDNLAQLQINSMKAESMLQTTVQVTTRLVNAYKEIMQMQV